MSNTAILNPSGSGLIRELVAWVQHQSPKTTITLAGITGFLFLSGLAIVCFSGSRLSIANGLVIIGREAPDAPSRAADDPFTGGTFS